MGLAVGKCLLRAQKRFSVCGEVKELGYWSFGVVVLSEVGIAAS